VKRFLIVDDHPLFREALEKTARLVASDVETFEAATIDEALAVLALREVDLTILDLSLPGTTGLSGLVRLRKAFPRSPIVINSCHKDPQIIASALSLGVCGYIPKSASKDEVVRSIGVVLGGSICLPSSYRMIGGAGLSKGPAQELLKRLNNLTSQQLRILELIHRGLQNKQIAYALQICETTVKVHVSEILRKLEVGSRTKAIVEMSKIEFANLTSDGPRKFAQELV
jgi:DNA-binding NarL/FixJ family response regulator